MSKVKINTYEHISRLSLLHVYDLSVCVVMWSRTKQKQLPNYGIIFLCNKPFYHEDRCKVPFNAIYNKQKQPVI